MIYYVSSKNPSSGDGTEQNPFRTIGSAATLAQAGDTVIIGEGVYREWVKPKNGGLSETQRITYRAAQGAHPVISGAEVVVGWCKEQDHVWSVMLKNDFFGGYHPFEEEIFGDWYDDFGQRHHIGELYLDGEAMYEAASLRDLYDPQKKPERILRWFAETDGGCTTIHANFAQYDPNTACTEVSVRPFCFFPEQEGVNYITVSGLTLCRAATQWAPPTAFQPGVIGPHWSRGWVIENCIVHDSKCVGISLGKRHDEEDNAWTKDPSKDGSQTYTEIIFKNIQNGWNREKVGGHVIRNNLIYNCGQAGIAGCMGAAFSTISGNHIHHVNIRGEFGGAEMSGIKLHAAVDAVIEDNCIHDCIRGLWLDWQAQGTAVRRNVMFDNRCEDLFIEVCHGPCTVENNLMLSKRNFLNVSQGTALIHNLFAGEIVVMRDVNRFTLYHRPHSTMIGGVTHIFSGDDKIAANLFVGGRSRASRAGTSVYNGCSPEKGKRKSGKVPFLQKLRNRLKGVGDLSSGEALPVDIFHNVYLGGARPYQYEQKARVCPFCPELSVQWEDGHAYLCTNLYGAPIDLTVDQITADRLGKAFESGQAYENRDGTPFIVDTDFLNLPRHSRTLAGPFAAPQERVQLV